MAKAVSWRFTATAVTAIVAFLVTGSLQVAIGIGGIDAIAKFIIYFGHEELWNRVQFGRVEKEASVLWLTGLSGAGKSTQADRLVKKFKDQGMKVELLDGDSIREVLPQTGFSKADRLDHNKRVAFLASRLQAHGINVIVSMISPFEEGRQFAQKVCKNFHLIHIATPLEICEDRDVKGLYARARAGEIKNFTGLDDPYEEPKSANLIVDTSGSSEEESQEEILSYLKEKKAA